MPKETQRGYLSGVLQRGSRIVRAANRTAQRAPFSPDSGRPASVTPLEIEAFSSSPTNKSRPADPRPAQTHETQPNVSNQSSQLEPSGTTQKLASGRTTTKSPTRSSETGSSVPAIPRSVENQNPEPPSANASSQISAGTEPTPVTTSPANHPRQVVEPTARHKETRSAIAGETQSGSEKTEAAKPGRTAPSESSVTRSFRVRDSYSDVRRASPPESETDRTDFKMGALTRPDEPATSKTLPPGFSRSQVFRQPSASAAPELTKAEPKRETDLSSPQRNSANVVAESREALIDATVANRESTLALPRAENSTEVFAQQPPPQLTERIFSQRPPLANPTSRAASPRLTINRLDIQIVDQAPQPPIVVPMRPAARPDGAENIERYQLGHLHLIF